MSFKEMVSKQKQYGFRLPSIFGYSTFHIYLFKFDNGGWEGLGANGWYLEVAIGPPMWNTYWSIKVK